MANVDLDIDIPVTRLGRSDTFRVIPLALDEGTDPVYISRYFAGAEAGKPQVVIEKSAPGESLGTLISYLLAKSQVPIDVRVACRFLWRILPNFTTTLEGNWVSHKQQIGINEAEITPRNLLSLVGGQEGTAVTGTPMGEDQWLRALALVLSPIRLQTGLRCEYLDQLAARYRTVADELSGQRTGDQHLGFATTHSAWEQNVTYM